MADKKQENTLNCKRSTVSLFMEYYFEKECAPDLRMTME
jgi:hypothetical protein